MKKFDIKSDIDEATYVDKYTLTIIDDDKNKDVIEMDTEELLDLHHEVQHAVDTNII